MVGTKKGSQITVSRDFVENLDSIISLNRTIIESYGYYENLCIAVPFWLLHVLSTMPYYSNFEQVYHICYTLKDNASWNGCKVYPNYKNEIAVYHNDMPFYDPQKIQIIQIESSTQ